MIRFIRHQYKHACRHGFGRREAITRALRFYMRGFK
jgi:hypothetical protein